MFTRYKYGMILMVFFTILSISGSILIISNTGDPIVYDIEVNERYLSEDEVLKKGYDPLKGRVREDIKYKHTYTKKFFGWSKTSEIVSGPDYYYVN